jgi:TRAP-type uncharacterized transport system substrate-binding protein
MKSPPRNARWGFVAAVAAVGLAALFLFLETRPRTYRLRVTGGDPLGSRHRIAALLAQEAKPGGVALTVVGTSGSREALEKVASGELDLALVQGGIGQKEGVEQVAAVAVEPLHLLVKPELEAAVRARGLAALRGKRLNLSTKGSGTRKLAEEALSFAGLEAGRGYADAADDYAALERLPYEKLPDALFTVSLMPSSVVEYLIRHDGYRIVPVPIGRALALRDFAVREAVIPAYAYGVAPPAPPADTPTLGTQLLLVARRDTPPEAVSRLLSTLLDGRFARAANLPVPDEAEIVRAPEMPIHAGTTAYLRRNDPVLTGDRVETLENLRSFVASVAVAAFLIWRWLRQRRYLGFESYFTEVTRLEQEALTLERQAIPPVGELLRLRAELGRVKTEALERFARGELKGAELMSGFLTHVNDVRGHLTALVMSERERIADEARDTVPDDEQDARFRAEWAAAIAEAE